MSVNWDGRLKQGGNMSNRTILEVSLGNLAERKRRSADEPVRILLLGDFSAQGDRPEDIKPRRVSYETLDATLADLAPKITVAVDQPLSIDEDLTIGSMDEFHPDALVSNLSAIRTLKILADRLADPSARDQALSQLAELTGETVSEPPQSSPSSAADPQSEADNEMVERLLGSPASASARSRAQQKVEAFIRNAMGAAQIETPSPTAERGRRQVAELMTATMRAILMSQPLRTLERAWRSAEWLIQRLDDETAEIFILDLSKENLATHLQEHAEHLDRSALHRIFCEPDTGDSWDLLVGDYSFSLSADDLLLLTTLGALAGQAAVPFLAHGDLSLCGCDSLDQIDAPWDWHLPEDDVGQLWAEVRSHPAAQWIGLATPQILLRQPYGPETDPIDAFDFSELPTRPEMASFLWGNPAIGCAYLLARARAGDTDAIAPEDLEIEDLPAVLYDDGTGQALQPPVETLVGERAQQQIQASGLIAMLGHRNGNAVRCPDLSAVSSQPVRFLG